MKLFDIILFIVIFSVFVGLLNDSGLFGGTKFGSTKILTIEGAAPTEDDIAKIEDIAGSGGVGSNPMGFGLLKGAFSALRIFMNVVMALMVIYIPLTKMGMPGMLAGVIQAGIYIMYVAFLFQVFTGRSLKNME